MLTSEFIYMTLNDGLMVQIKLLSDERPGVR